MGAGINRLAMNAGLDFPGFEHARRAVRKRVTKLGLVHAIAANSSTIVFDSAPVMVLAPGQGIEPEWVSAQIIPQDGSNKLILDFAVFHLTTFNAAPLATFNRAPIVGVQSFKSGFEDFDVPAEVPGAGIFTYQDVREVDGGIFGAPQTGMPNVFLELDTAWSNTDAGAAHSIQVFFAMVYHLITGISEGN